jgi:PAS domain S-box-containing protein
MSQPSRQPLSEPSPPPADGSHGSPEPPTPDELGSALHRARASFHSLLDISPELVLVHRDGHVAYINPASVRALGLGSADERIGTPVARAFHDEDRGVVEARVMAPAANSTHETFGLRWLGKGGTYRTTEAAAAPIDLDGSAAVVIVARDVTERVEFQHQLLQRERMAALGTLSAGVAHEINNPLTYLLVNLEHVLRRLRAASASDDPIAELSMVGVGGGGLAGLALSLQQAVEGANRVRQIVRDLLTFSQGNVEQRGMSDVRGIVESATQMAWHEIRHRARLVKSLAEVPPVDANEARLGQVFLNLLVNAAQAIPEGHADKHEIRVATRTDDHGNVVIEVSDTGMGILPENIPRIFDPFFTTKGETGTGLGLSISHGAVRSLGGDIKVTSTLGQGTTFQVILPPAKSWRGAVPVSSHDVRALTRKRVLVVDDERLVGEAIARALAEENDVEVVTEARQALARIAKGDPFDLILCDLMMPVMTGMDLYAEIVRVAPKLVGRLVFMTGGAFTPRARAFLESVNNPCLEKPLDTSKLRSIIARAGKD